MSNNSFDDIDNGLGYILLFRLIVWGYIGMVLSLFGIIGNIITIIVLISPSMRKTSTNIYLTAISCSNILFLLIFIPSYSIKYLLGYDVYMSNQPPFAFEILLTRLPTTPVYNTILLSIIYLTIGLSMDRLILIKFPLKSKRILTKRVTFVSILLIYIFSIVYCVPYWLEQRYIPEVKQCRLTEIGKRIYKYIRIYIYIPVVYVIPLVTLTCINKTIIQNLVAKKRHKQSLTGRTTRKKTADYHITLMLVIVIIAFVLSQLPLLILNVWFAIDSHNLQDSLKFHSLNSIGILLIVLNTSTNFLLYCFFGQQFRETLLKFIVKLLPKHTKKFNVQKRTSKSIQLPLLIHSRISGTASITTINDSKFINTRPNESSSPLDQIPTIISKEEFCPLLTSTTIPMIDSPEQITILEERSQLNSSRIKNQVFVITV
jgi:hypothetical protein